MRPSTDLTLLLVLAALFIFHSPFTRWWASLQLPWYTVFVLWFLLIVLIALNNRAGESRSDDSKTGGD
jgi:hypothetical protein